MDPITVRLYEELNDALPPARRKRPFTEEVGNGETVATLLRHRLPRAVAAHLHWLRQCPACHRLYWHGSHAERLAQRVTRLLTTSAIPR